MPTVTILGPQYVIELDQTGTYDVQDDIYEVWKQWVKAGNAQYPEAIATVGGDPIGAAEFVAPYFFLRNDLGWRIKAPEEDGEVIIKGNLFGRDPTKAVFLPASGDFNVLVRLEVSARSTVIQTPTSGLTSAESQLLFDLRKLLLGKKVTRRSNGTYVVLNPGFTDPDAPGAIFKIANELFEDEEETQVYRRQGIEVLGELVDPP